MPLQHGDHKPFELVHIHEKSALMAPGDGANDHFINSAISTNSTEVVDVNDEAAEERKKLIEDQGHTSLIRPFLIQLIPLGMTASIVQLSIRSVYFFDIKNSTYIVRLSRFSIGVNELLKCLQFIAKIHEILLVGSLSTIVLHFLRLAILRRRNSGAPPASLIAAGYNIRSGDFIFKSSFWKAGRNPEFWILGVFLAVCAIIANILGPASAIALVPSLDWWQAKAAFGEEVLPVGVAYDQSELWPLKLSKMNIPYQSGSQSIQNGISLSPDVCLTPLFTEWPFCPGRGWDNIRLWAKAYSKEGVAANVTIVNSRSNSQRVIQSQLSSRELESTSRPAIATSLSSSFTTLISSLWQFIGTRDYPINHMSRPRLRISKRQTVMQPLVQVQCEHFTLNQFSWQKPQPSNYSKFEIYGSGINKFTKIENQVNHTWTLPNSFDNYTYQITAQNIAKPALNIETVDFTWVDIADHNRSSASIAAIVVTPATQMDKYQNPIQGAMGHACTVDARWAATDPIYDHTASTVVQHNLTDTLFFQKSNPRASGDSEPWGISPIIAIDSSWANALNLDIAVNNKIAKAIPWLLEPFIISSHVGGKDPALNGTSYYDFSPVYHFAENTSALQAGADYAPLVSETIATILSVFLTDALARVANDKDYFIALENTPGTLTAINLLSFGGKHLTESENEVNTTNERFRELYPSQIVFEVERYGYGYGLRSKSVQFGILILLIHVLMSLLFLTYTTYTFYFGDKWINGALCTMPELAAVVMKSELGEEFHEKV